MKIRYMIAGMGMVLLMAAATAGCSLSEPVHKPPTASATTAPSKAPATKTATRKVPPTAAAKKIEPTKTPQKPANTPEPLTSLYVKAIGMDEYGRFNSLLVSHAMKDIGNYNIRNAGVYHANLNLKRSASYGLFAKCFNEEDRLFDVLSKLSYQMSVNGTEVDTGKFEWLYVRDPNGKFCAVPGALVTDIERGVFHITITETLREAFSDSVGVFETGDYVYDMTVQFE